MEGKGLSKGEGEGAKDKLCLCHYFAKNLALADRPERKPKLKPKNKETKKPMHGANADFIRKLHFSTLFGNHVFICFSQLDCKLLQARNRGLNFSEYPVTGI